MTTPYIGEIQLFGFNFPPRNWAYCNGTLLSIQQNTALFSLLGTQYGGNGTTNFQLPNLIARAACGQGDGNGLTPRTIGETFGAASVTLNVNEMPGHSHPFVIYNQNDTSKRASSPSAGNSLGVPSSSAPFTTAGTPNAQFAPGTCGVSGGNQPHENQQPYLAMNFCISLSGVYPSFN